MSFVFIGVALLALQPAMRNDDRLEVSHAILAASKPPVVEVQIQLLDPHLASRHGFTAWCLFFDSSLADARSGQVNDATRTLLSIPESKERGKKINHLQETEKSRLPLETQHGLLVFDLDARSLRTHEAVLSKLSRSHPKSVTLANSLALSERYSGKPNDAEQRLRKWTELHSSPAMLINLAFWAYQRGDISAAMKLCEQANATAPKWPLPLMLAFDCAIKQKDARLADTLAVKLLDLRPRDARWMAIRSQVLALTEDSSVRDIKQAKALATTAMSLNTSEPLAKDALAIVLAQEKLFQQALDIYDSGIRDRGIKLIAGFKDALRDKFVAEEPVMGLEYLHIR